MGTDQLRDRRGVTATGRQEDVFAAHRMLTHDRAFLVGMAARGQQHLVGNADLADVMEARGQADLCTGLLTQVAVRGRALREQADAVAVVAGVGVAHLQRHRERIDQAGLRVQQVGGGYGVREHGHPPAPGGDRCGVFGGDQPGARVVRRARAALKRSSGNGSGCLMRSLSGPSMA